MLEYSTQVAQWRDYLEQARQAGYFCTVGTPRASCFSFVGVSGWSGWARGKEETLMTINASNIANTIFRNEKIPSERSRFICFCFLY